MPSREDKEASELLYAEGMKYDWSQDRSPAAAALARACLQGAAGMGHGRAIRALAHLLYEGRGGPPDPEGAILMLWSAFLHGEHDALEELEDMLEMRAESESDQDRAKAMVSCAQTIDKLKPLISRVAICMHDMARERNVRKVGKLRPS